MIRSALDRPPKQPETYEVGVALPVATRPFPKQVRDSRVITYIPTRPADYQQMAYGGWAGPASLDFETRTTTAVLLRVAVDLGEDYRVTPNGLVNVLRKLMEGLASRLWWDDRVLDREGPEIGLSSRQVRAEALAWLRIEGVTAPEVDW